MTPDLLKSLAQKAHKAATSSTAEEGMVSPKSADIAKAARLVAVKRLMDALKGDDSNAALAALMCFQDISSSEAEDESEEEGVEE